MFETDDDDDEQRERTPPPWSTVALHLIWALAIVGVILGPRLIEALR